MSNKTAPTAGIPKTASVYKVALRHLRPVVREGLCLAFCGDKKIMRQMVRR